MYSRKLPTLPTRIFRILLIIAFACLAFSCKEEKVEPEIVSPPVTDVDDDDELELKEGQFPITGNLQLPDGLDASSIKVSTSAGVFEVDDAGQFEAAHIGFEKQFLFAENNSGELLLASVVSDGTILLNAASTAEALIAMHPSTATFSKEQLPSFIQALKEYDEYAELIVQIELSVSNNVSPLNDTEVLEVFTQLFSRVSAGNESARKRDLIEIDNLVEPRIDFLDGEMLIRNDATTTAAWGVEVLLDDVSLTGALVLPGNEVGFPGLSSIWNAFKGDFSDAVFKEADTLKVQILDGEKFRVEFTSPTSPEIIDSEPAQLALEYNIRLSFISVWNALGLPGLKASDYLEIYECGKEPIDALTDVTIAAIQADKFNSSFFLDQISKTFAQGVDMFSNCASLFDNYPGSEFSSTQSYLQRLTKFLDFYSKAEAAFAVGKRVGDMLVLSDIAVCRQVIDGKIFPCFSLVKDLTYDSVALLDETIQLTVDTKIDVTSPDVTAYPVGALIQWKITEGDGWLTATSAMVEGDGKARISYRVGEMEKQVVTAYVSNKNGAIIDKVDYVITLNNFQELSAYINGAYWTAEGAYYATSIFNNGVGTPTAYQRYIQGSKANVSVGDVSSISLLLESHFEPYEISVGTYSLGYDNDRSRFSGFTEGMALSISLGGTSSTPQWANDNVSLVITSVKDGVIEGTFSFQVKEKGAEGEEDKLLYDVTNGYFKINRTW